MNKKTYTLTFHSAINYGAVLQTIALQRILKNNKINNKVVDYTDKCMNYYNPLNYDNLSFKGIIKKRIKNLIYGKKMLQKYNLFHNFIKSNIDMTSKVNNLEEIEKIISNDSILITGSDQVWSCDILNGLSDIYSLNFKNTDIKKISYAASIGKERIEEEYKQEFVKKLSDFSYISVREESAKIELDNILLDKNIEVVLDPTMLLTAEEWTDLSIKYKKDFNEKYIVAYTMDENIEYIKIANYLSKITGYKIIYFDMKNLGFKNILENEYVSNPYEFINIIKNAEYVVTNSFHGTVFSILFNKKMWVIPHKTKGTRMINLLNKLDMSDRIIYSLDEFQKIDFNKEIDYTNINKKLEQERNRSIEWLLSSIK